LPIAVRFDIAKQHVAALCWFRSEIKAGRKPMLLSR
jgi:hypothetical protein